MRTLGTVTDLEHVVGARPPTGHLKSISFLDDHCTTFLAHSPLSVLGVEDRDGVLRASTAGGAPGAVRALGPRELALAGAQLDAADDGAPIGLLALVPGHGETLRVNGRLRLGGEEPVLTVEEAFLHCAKAVIRSRLWDEAPSVRAAAGGEAAVAGFLAASPFVLLATIDGGGEADVSPKGDPAGFVRLLDDGRLAVPDRPGNKRTDTMHNLVDDPRIGLLGLLPGTDRVLLTAGRAEITDDPGLLAQLAEGGKVPAAAIVVDVVEAEVRTNPIVAQAGLWAPGANVAPGTLPRGCKVWADHVQLNDDPGDDLAQIRPLITEDALADGIDQDYRENLY